MQPSTQMQPPLKGHKHGHSGSAFYELAEYVSELDPIALEYIRCRTDEASSLSVDYGRMWQYIESIYRAGGKRLRPYLAYSIYCAFSRTKVPSKGLLQVTAAIEFLHMAMLIHDDIIDRDYIRHGQANISGLYRHHYGTLHPSPDNNHHADAAAILSGDALISEAYHVIMTAEISNIQKNLLSAAFSKAIFEVIGGELLDTEAVYYEAKLVDSKTIAHLKTASYSCIMPLRVGAIMAGADMQTLDIINTIGSSIGIAFQMADDELGIFGDETLTGKSASNDLRQGKRTMLLQLSLEMASQKDRMLMTDILSKADLSDNDIQTCRNIIERSGARQQHALQRQSYTDKAVEAVTQLPISDSDGLLLVQLLRNLAERVG